MNNYDLLREKLIRELKRKFPQADLELIKDAASEAVAVVHQNPPPEDVREKSNKLYGWHSTIAYRYLCDAIERNKREIQIADDDFPVFEADFIVKFEDHETSIQFLGILTDKEREAVVLHKMVGYTVKEVASICHITRNTVKDRFKRGVARLREFVHPPPMWKTCV